MVAWQKVLCHTLKYSGIDPSMVIRRCEPSHWPSQSFLYSPGAIFRGHKKNFQKAGMVYKASQHFQRAAWWGARASRCAVRHDLDVPDFKLGHSQRNDSCHHETKEKQGVFACFSFSHLFWDGHTFSKFRGVPRYCTQFQKMFANYMTPSKTILQHDCTYLDEYRQ